LRLLQSVNVGQYGLSGAARVPTLVNDYSEAGPIIQLGAMVEEYRNSTEPWVESKADSLVILAES
jgi:hypothetical protein